MTYAEKPLPAGVEPGTRGFVFATTGQSCTDLARRAARTLRTVMPDAAIDIFTDQPVADDVFDKVHVLTDSAHGLTPRAIRCSRFARTILLQADVFVLADLSEVFEGLDRYDIVGVHEASQRPRLTPDAPHDTSSLNPVDTGLLAFRASQALHAFSRAWEEDLNANTGQVGQPSLRDLIHQSELAFGTLGRAYTSLKPELLDHWTAAMGAPRILHLQSLPADSTGDPQTPYDLDEVIGKTRARQVTALLQQHPANAPITQTRRTERGNRTGDQEPQKSPAAGTQVVPDYHTEILALASQGRPVRICVIGANDGKANDPIYALVRDKLRSNSEILLFEPQPYLLQFLQQNYRFHPAHKIINAAIGPQDSLTLHAIRPEHWDRFNPPYAADWPSYRAPTGVTSFNRENVVTWVRQHLPDEQDPDSLVAALTVPSGRLVAYLRDHWNDTMIDVLQIDAEGFDDQVIYACDIEVTRPKVLRFESAHLSPERLARLRAHLTKTYRLIDLNHDMLAIRRG